MGRNRSSLDDGWGGPAVFRAEDGLKPANPPSKNAAASLFTKKEIDYRDLTQAVELFSPAITEYVSSYVRMASQRGPQFANALQTLGDTLEYLNGAESDGAWLGQNAPANGRSAVEIALGHANVQDFIATISRMAREDILRKQGIDSRPGMFERANIVDPYATIYTLVQNKVVQSLTGSAPSANQTALPDDEARDFAVFNRQTAMRMQQEMAQGQVEQARTRTLMLAAMAGKLFSGATWASMGHSLTEMGHSVREYCSDKLDSVQEFTSDRIRLYPRLFKHYQRAIGHWASGLTASVMAKLDTLYTKLQKFVGLAPQLEAVPVRGRGLDEDEVAAMEAVAHVAPKTAAFKRISGTAPLVARAAVAVRESQEMRRGGAGSSWAYKGMQPQVAFYKAPADEEEAAATFGPAPLRPTKFPNVQSTPNFFV